MIDRSQQFCKAIEVFDDIAEEARKTYENILEIDEVYENLLEAGTLSDKEIRSGHTRALWYIAIYTEMPRILVNRADKLATFFKELVERKLNEIENFEGK